MPELRGGLRGRVMPELRGCGALLAPMPTSVPEALAGHWGSCGAHRQTLGPSGQEPRVWVPHSPGYNAVKHVPVSDLGAPGTFPEEPGEGVVEVGDSGVCHCGKRLVMWDRYYSHG